MKLDGVNFFFRIFNRRDDIARRGGFMKTFGNGRYVIAVAHPNVERFGQIFE